MKHLLTVIMVALVLAAVVAGCGGAPRYDARLTAADSLMQAAPDSALAIVEAVCRDSLAGEGDRAYHDLLLTQARYRNYITATSDSDINCALAWYRAHSGEREKLTRALIYKGAVMDELGHPDSAMLYYKQAEATAAPDDYFNLGYANMRIGSLFQDQYSQDQIAIECLNEAIHYFELLQDTNYLILCYGDLGAICGSLYPDTAYHCLVKAIELAQQFDSLQLYTYKSKLAGFYIYAKEDYTSAKSISMDIIQNGADKCYETQFYYYAAMSFLKLGQLDSAKYVFGITPRPTDAVDSMAWYEVMAGIADAESRQSDCLFYTNQLNELKHRIVADNKEKEIVSGESDFHKQQAAVHKRQSSTLFAGLAIVALVVVLLLATVAVLRYRIRVKNAEISLIENELKTAITTMNEKIEKLGNDKAAMSTVVKYRIEALHELFNSIRFKVKEQKYNRRNVITLSGLFDNLGEHYVMSKVELPDSFWKKIELSVDGEFRGIASYIKQNYPDLSVRDYRIFCLLCADVSPHVIKICMNFSNVKTSSNYRNLIVRKKLGLDMSFDEFVKNYMKNGHL